MSQRTAFPQEMMVHTAPCGDAALDGASTIVGTLPFVILIQRGPPVDGVNQRRIRTCPEGDDRAQCGVRFGLARIAGDITFIKQTDESRRIPGPAQRFDDLYLGVASVLGIVRELESQHIPSPSEKRHGPNEVLNRCLQTKSTAAMCLWSRPTPPHYRN